MFSPPKKDPGRIPVGEKEHQILQISFHETLESVFVNRLGQLAKAEKVFAEHYVRIQRRNLREDTNPAFKQVSFIVGSF